ncbi:SAM-dependent methyltransferase [Deltaproteobacteria bacterium Smac51]|nr:SAM-dependent methyltransferase [Deltaproteobacteria bacterium Smac51]
MFQGDWTPKDLFSLGSQTWVACAVQAAVRLQLFTALDVEGGLPVGELARRIGGNERAVGMLATALTAVGLLNRDGDLVSLTGQSRRYLSTKSDEYFGFIIRHQANILRSWIHLDEAVKTGSSVAERSSKAEGDSEENEAFLMGMFNVARLQADTVAQALKKAGVMEGRQSVLDLGGGPGTYAIYFCRNFPEIRATVFDQPATEKFASATFERYGLSDRINFVSGNFLESDLPKGYDLVWASQVLHGETPADAARLIKRGAECLNPGGCLCVQEFIIDDDLRGPAHSALFSLNMLVQTPGGQSYTESELTNMLTAAGLGNIRRVPAELPPGCGIIAGEKM